jgi:hypothetical protein
MTPYARLHAPKPNRLAVRAVTLVGLWVVTARGALSAQVGYDPAHSPYRDIPRGGVAVVSAGYLSGSRGSVGVGLSNGATAGLRYEVQFGAVGASLGLGYGLTSRYVWVVDPLQAVPARKTGPFDNRVVLADAGLQLVLSGRKTWHHFAPFVGAAIGLAATSGAPRDTSGYDFGTKIMLAPNFGLRWYPARSLSVRSDFRLVFWKLTYPAAYKVPNSVTGTSVLPSGAALSEWTSHPWATIGVGWIF